MIPSPHPLTRTEPGQAPGRRTALALAMAWTLLGCDPRPAAVPQPKTVAAPTAPADRPDLTMPRTASSDGSVPSAETVFAASGTAQQASAPQARAQAEMTPAQESRSMPMPGQANDHSVPVLPPKPAGTR